MPVWYSKLNSLDISEANSNPLSFFTFGFKDYYLLIQMRYIFICSLNLRDYKNVTIFLCPYSIIYI